MRNEIHILLKTPWHVFWVLLLATLGAGCTSVPVNLRGERPASAHVQATLSPGGLVADNMRRLGPDPQKPPESLNKRLVRKPSKTIYTSNPQDCPPGMTIGYGNENFHGADRKTFHATGVGAPPPKYYSPQQRRLLTIRAAQLDAMRNLTEQVYGMELYANTTIGDMVMENDRARTMVDQYLKGAFVISGNPLVDGTYETTVQLTLINPLLYRLRAEAILPRCIFIEDMVK